jgi:RluA family pseudouridine synthase
MILYGDEHLLAVDKPPGLPTLPDGYHKDAPCLIHLLQTEFGRVWVVHRLDKDTSGVIVLARSAEVHRAMNLAFDSREVQKIYHALVIGVPEWEDRVIDLPLRPDGDRRHRTVIDLRRGKPAITRCRVLERFTGHTLVEVKPETGRTHQIRAHLAAAGFPLVGDVLYGGKKANGLMERTALHAHSIQFVHPVTKGIVKFEAEYPEDFRATLDWLRDTE